MRTGRSTAHLLSVALLACIAGCGRKPGVDEGTGKTPPPAAAPAGDDFRIDVVREVEGVVFGSPERLKPVVQSVQVTRIDASQARGKAGPAIEAAAKRGILLGDSVFEITASKPSETDAWLGGPLLVSLPLSEAQKKAARRGNVGGVYLSELGPFFIRGGLDEQAGTVTFPVMHLSWFSTGVRSPEEEISAFIRGQAEEMAGMAEEAVTERIKEAVDDYLDRLLPADVKASSKAKLLAKIWERREEIAAIAESAGKDDTAGIATDTSRLLGKVIVDNLDDGAFKSVMDSLADNADLAKSAGRSLAMARKGDYWAAVEVLGRAAGEKTAIYQAVSTAASGVQKAIDLWQEHEFEAAYAAYTKGAPAGFMGFRKPVQDHDWTQLVSNYGGIAETVRMRFGITDPEQASSHAKKMFDEREKTEAARKKTEDKLERIRKYFFHEKSELLRNGLLERVAKRDAPPAEQFAAILGMVKTIEKDLAAMGIKGGVLEWTDVRAGKYGLQEQARSLLYAMSQGGAQAYQARLAEIRASLANNRKMPEPAPATPAQPVPGPKKATTGEMAYEVQLSGDWADRFDLEKKESRLGVAWVGTINREVQIGNGKFPAKAVWTGKVEQGSGGARVMKGEIRGTVYIRQGDGGWDEGETADVSGSFEGTLSSPGPRFDGEWKITIRGVVYKGKWGGALRK